MRPSRAPVRALVWLLAGALFLAATSACAAAATFGGEATSSADLTPAAAPAVSEVREIGLTVSDLERSIAFFRDVLDFRQEAPIEEHAGPERERLEGVFGLRLRSARLALGQETIELTQYLAPEGRALPPDSASNDRWFQHLAIVVSDMDKAYAHLRAHNVRHASSAPQRLPDWNPSAGGIEAFYFKDHDGHVLEVIAFPAGKGDPRWQRPTERLFLGIDHTAIVVEDTGASLAFYRDALGLAVAGESENWGNEQEHLNHVFGARLRITALRAARGPGIELLEYLAPQDGRPYPTDARANDLVHWETRLVAGYVAALARTLPRHGARLVSPGAVTLSGGTEAVLLRDPDGHALELHAPGTPAGSW